MHLAKVETKVDHAFLCLIVLTGSHARTCCTVRSLRWTPSQSWGAKPGAPDVIAQVRRPQCMLAGRGLVMAYAEKAEVSLLAGGEASGHAPQEWCPLQARVRLASAVSCA